MRYPYMLFLMILPVIFLFRELINSGSKADFFYSVSTYSDKGRAVKSFILRHIYLTVMYFTGMVMFVIALAGPVQKTEAPAGNADTFTTDTLFVFDISKSMIAPDFEKSRLEKSIDTAIDILNSSEGRFGIVIFKGSAFTLLPLTENIEMVSDSLIKIESDMFTSGGTDIGKGLLHALKLFPDFEKTDKKIILFTDGEEPLPGSFNRFEREIRKNFSDKVISMLIIIPDNLSGAEVPEAADPGGRAVISVPDIENLGMILDTAGNGSIISFSSFSPAVYAAFNPAVERNIDLSRLFSSIGMLFFIAALFIKGKKWIEPGK